MFHKAETLVGNKINTTFKVICELRKWGSTEETDFAWILHKYKKQLRAYYRLFAILRQYSEEEEHEENEIENLDEVYN